MNSAIGGGGMDMMTGMTLGWLLVWIVLILVAAAAIKYIFFNKDRKD